MLKLGLFPSIFLLYHPSVPGDLRTARLRSEWHVVWLCDPQGNLPMSPCLAVARRSLSSLLAGIRSHVCRELFPHLHPYRDEGVCAYGHTHCSAGDGFQSLHALDQGSRYYRTVSSALHPCLVGKAMGQFPLSVRTVPASGLGSGL